MILGVLLRYPLNNSHVSIYRSFYCFLINLFIYLFSISFKWKSNGYCSGKHILGPVGQFNQWKEETLILETARCTPRIPFCRNKVSPPHLPELTISINHREWWWSVQLEATCGCQASSFVLLLLLLVLGELPLTETLALLLSVRRPTSRFLPLLGAEPLIPLQPLQIFRPTPTWWWVGSPSLLFSGRWWSVKYG